MPSLRSFAFFFFSDGLYKEQLKRVQCYTLPATAVAFGSFGSFGSLLASTTMSVANAAATAAAAESTTRVECGERAEVFISAY